MRNDGSARLSQASSLASLGDIVYQQNIVRNQQ